MLRARGLLDVLTPLTLQTRIRRKDGTENFGGFVYVVDGFLQRDFVLWVFMCSINFSVSFPATTPRANTPHVSLFRPPRRGLPRPIYTARAITPRAITPLPPLHGYHACVYISRLVSRHSLVLLLGYHNRAITLHHTRTSGYHTRHSSYLVVRSLPSTGYHATCFSPSTPPPGRHTYQPTPQIT